MQTQLAVAKPALRRKPFKKGGDLHTVTVFLPEDVTREIASYNNQQTIIDEQERQIKELKNKLAKVEEAVPALFASVGDVFTHATDDRGDAGDVFEYEGHTKYFYDMYFCRLCVSQYIYGRMLIEFYRLQPLLLIRTIVRRNIYLFMYEVCITT